MLKNWMHHMHDEGLKATHYTTHMLHERSFWGIMAILALIAALFTIIVIYGNNAALQEYSAPIPYAPYF
jgi:hypothetical protein